MGNLQTFYRNLRDTGSIGQSRIETEEGWVPYKTKRRREPRLIGIPEPGIRKNRIETKEAWVTERSLGNGAKRRRLKNGVSLH
jgi:hypothetical protein